MIDSMIGKRGYKKYGYFRGLVGNIQSNHDPFGNIPYKIVFSNGSSVTAWGKDIYVTGEQRHENEVSAARD